MSANKIPEGIDQQLIPIYAHELFNLAHEIKEKCEQVFELTPEIPKEPEHYVAAAPEIHRNIQSILISAANIKKLIITPSTKLKGENNTIHGFRLYRSSFLNELLGNVVLEEIVNHKVRNTLEHFDEYMDKAVVNLSNPTKRPSPWAAYNLIASSKGVFKPNIYPIKYYVADEEVFYNMKWSINIRKMYDEALSIMNALQETESFKQIDSPGALLITLKK